MRILQVIDILNRGGAERVLVDLSNLLKSKKHDVGVMMLVDSGPLASDLSAGIQKIKLNRTNKYSLFTAKKFVSTLNEYDIVHIHMRHVLLYYFFCSVFFKTKPKVVFHDHWGDIGFDRRTPFYLKWLKNKIYYVGVSRDLCNWAKEIVMINPERVFLLANIVAIDFKKKSEHLRRNRVLMISNFRRTKNIEFALRAIHEIIKECSVNLDVYGRDQDTDYLTELQFLKSQLGLDQYVNFIVNASDVRDKISDYDAAIHTATSETGPLVLIEYLANQLPFLSYCTGEVAEQLRGSLSNYFRDDFDVHGWANNLKSILVGEYHYGSSQLNELFDQYYSTARYVEACEDIYSKVLRDGQQ